MTRIMIVEDNAVTRSFLVALFSGTPEFEVVAGCGSAEEALAFSMTRRISFR